jgi:hypothetical protein
MITVQPNIQHTISIPRLVPRPGTLPSKVLLERGWCQDRVVDRKGRLCLIGAIQEALAGMSVSRQACSDVTRAVVEEVADRRTSIPAWNDRDTTTFDDVLGVAREAERRLGWRV